MKNSFRLTALLLIWLLLGSWGFTVHRTVNQLAVYELPGNLRTFFHNNIDYIVRHSVRPDLRRNEDPSEDTKHFINFEYFGDSAAWKMPTNWPDAVERYSRDSLLKHGYVPYHIIEMKHRLTLAFRSQNKDSILFYAADLAHYVADAHVPLHVTANYDGQLTGQKGLHSLWESFIPELSLDGYDLSSKRTARYLKNPEKSIWTALQTAYLLTNDIFLQEKQTSKNFPDSAKYRVQVRRGIEVRSYTSEFAIAYARRLGATINQQLLNSAALTSDFWFTCWVDSGRPDMKAFLSPHGKKDQKEQLKKECKSFRGNRLIQDRLLMARQNQNTSPQSK